MTLPNLGAHTDGGTITEGQDTKEDTSNLLDALLDNNMNATNNFVVTAGGTFQLNISGGQPNLDLYLASGLIRLTGTPGAGTTIVVPDGDRRISFQNVSGQPTTITTVTGASPVVNIPDAATKTLHVHGTDITIVADDSTQTGALLADGSIPASGDFDWADKELQRPLLVDYAEGVTTSIPSASVTFDLETGNVFDITMDQNTVFIFLNPPALPASGGGAGSFTAIFRQNGSGGHTITLPASVDWEAGSPPTFSNGIDQIDVVSFLTVDAGTTWFAFLGGLNFG